MKFPYSVSVSSASEIHCTPGARGSPVIVEAQTIAESIKVAHKVKGHGILAHAHTWVRTSFI